MGSPATDAAYKILDKGDIIELKKLVSDDRVLTGQEIGPDFSHDELGGTEKYPDVLIHVLTASEISGIVKYANSNHIPVTVRGSGTGLVGASVPVYGGIMICTAGMNRILELDEENLTLTVEPGVPLMEIAAFAEERGYFYPPDPGEKSATIGGNISTNAGGMRAVKYGVTRDYVRGLDVVLPSGQAVSLGGKVVKNSSGYSLKDLIIGSEGTLAIVTKAILKLLPLPKKSVSLLIPFTDIEQAIGSVPEIMKTKSIPTAVEFMEREAILDAERFLGKKFPHNDNDAYLLITYDGNSKEELESAYKDLAGVCFAKGALDMLIIDTDERKASVWPARAAFLEGIRASTTDMDECDVVVPKNKVADFVMYTYELKKKHGIRIKSFGHAGDGNLHIFILKDDLKADEWSFKLSAVFDDLYRKADEFGGKVSGEHGVGFAKKPYFERSEDARVLNIMKSIKTAFDPHNILNPGKILP